MNNDPELHGDNRDEYIAHQEAELAEAQGETIELVEDDELKQLLQEIWEEEAKLSQKREEEEYTEREAFDDFYANQQEEWN
jgi:hypothetical protein|tara:strand:+ start:762 stop:1004 length:243 start_codon:yes stop_codon:yes gene_type:complete